MIIDAILYNGEAECFDVRYHELKDVVGRFVVVETQETFTGKHKPLTFNGPWLNVHYDGLTETVEPPLKTDDPWQRETHQRNLILETLSTTPALNLADDDIILIGDADEIPSANAVREAAKTAAKGIQVSFDQTLTTYYVNNVCQNMRWRGTQAVRFDYLKRVTPQGVRDFRNGTPYVASNGGYHWSSLVLDDPVGRLTAKIQAFSHQEVNRPEVLDPDNIRRRVALGQDIQGRTDVQFKVEPNTPLPRYVSENKETFKTLFYPGSV
jgi:beta-1,4-mannosyl-glycoprotein beta-1,4-N-acetylglucosaminyltransferase